MQRRHSQFGGEFVFLPGAHCNCTKHYFAHILIYEQKIADALRHSLYDVSLLDCTLKNVSFLSDERIFENISLHGLVISSGEIKRVHRVAFHGLKTPLQALGLPNNALMSVPWNALTPFGLLERLDLSNNRIKALGATDFVVRFICFLLFDLN